MIAQKKLDGLHIIVAENYESMSRLAADLICREIKNKSNLLFCAATGNTPTRTYQLIAEAYKKDPTSFTAFRVLKLDEWVGLDVDDPATCEAYLAKHLLNPLAVEKDRYFGCSSATENLDEECRRMDGIMKNEGPIDLCLLGLGSNGHLGLNEPGENVLPSWHVTALTAASLDHSMLKLSKVRPSFGITLGMRDLLQSKHILLLVNGSHKKEALRKLFEQKITASFPASFLWLHSNVTLLCDRDGADHLEGILT